jgi:hypothetical protein
VACRHQAQLIALVAEALLAPPAADAATPSSVASAAPPAAAAAAGPSPGGGKAEAAGKGLGAELRRHLRRALLEPGPAVVAVDEAHNLSNPKAREERAGGREGV